MFGKERKLPMGLKSKEIGSVDGAGKINYYCDTAEEINRVQEKEASKLRKHEMPEGKRQ